MGGLRWGLCRDTRAGGQLCDWLLLYKSVARAGASPGDVTQPGSWLSETVPGGGGPDWGIHHPRSVAGQGAHVTGS